MKAAALSLPGVDMTARELVSQKLLRVDLTDKPIGYGLGNYGKRVLKVSLCPARKRPGANVSPTAYAHVLEIFGERNEPRFHKAQLCKLSLGQQAEVRKQWRAERFR